jgi:hypothetical protein
MQPSPLATKEPPRSRSALFRLRVTLLDSDPPIWRRILVAEDAPLDQMHHILQTVMGWMNSHVHLFAAGAVEYSEPGADWETPVSDERGVPISRLLGTRGDSVVYEYDLGDSWEHQILLEEIEPLEPLGQVAICLGGELAGPLEDSGGMSGYYAKLEVLRSPEHPAYRATKAWVERTADLMGRRSFDPDAFNVARVNAALRRLR